MVKITESFPPGTKIKCCKCGRGVNITTEQEAKIICKCGNNGPNEWEPRGMHKIMWTKITENTKKDMPNKNVLGIGFQDEALIGFLSYDDEEYGYYIEADSGVILEDIYKYMTIDVLLMID